jgi:hypothetical protein
MLAPVLAALWLAAPTASDARLSEAPTAAEPAPAQDPTPTPPAGGSGGFFGGDLTATPPAQPAAPPAEGPKAPPMPPIEELPSRSTPPTAGKSPGLSGIFGPKDRKPVSGGGVGFFDPGKLDDAGPGGGGIQVRGYLGLNFIVTERTNTAMRNPETGTFDRLKTLPYFGGGAANLYVGAPIYSDVVYARIAFEFISIPRAFPGAADIAPVYSPVVLMEAAALEINPFAWAKEKTGRWFSEGFKITGGVFIVPFGLEDEEHDAPVRWWVTRPLAMSFGRVYPGSWIDIGATIKWKPTFGGARPVRPLEIDFGVINGDACTQTRTADTLYRYMPVGVAAAPCEHQLREAEIARADGFVLGITPDNNGNKSIVGRVMIRPVPAFNFGGSVVWGKHPESVIPAIGFTGKSYPDTLSAPSWRVGAHLDLNLDEVVSSRIPLPHIRGELVYGVDAAARQRDPANPVFSDRRMFGAYAQIAQPLWRRKKTRLPGLIVQYRFDHADPDLAVPGRAPNGLVLSDFSDMYRYDERLQGHVVGLRFPVLPRFTLKAEYTFLREDGGKANRLYNDNFAFQAVADF